MVELSGATQLQAKLRALALAMQEQGALNAVRAGGEVIKDAMAERAVGARVAKQEGSNSLPKGAIQRDIKVRIAKDKTDVTAVIGPGKKTGYVARFVEYGHRMVKGGYSKVLGNGKTRGPGRQVRDIPAYPFLRPAYEASVADAVATRDAVLRQEIKKAVR